MENSERLEVRVSEEEMRRYKAAALAMGRKSLSRFVRDGLARICDLVETAQAPQHQAEPVQPVLNTDVSSEIREVVGTSARRYPDTEVARYTATHCEMDFWLMPEDQKQEWRDSYRLYREESA